MAEKRIPVSLKFDDSTDFYSSFITELKDSRTLSTTIVQILELYYNNEEVRTLVDKELNPSNSVTILQNQINLIQKMRTASLNNIGVLEKGQQMSVVDQQREEFLQKTQNFGIIGQPEAIQQKMIHNQPNPKNDERFNKLEEKLETMTSQFQQLMQVIAVGGTQTKTQQEVQPNNPLANLEDNLNASLGAQATAPTNQTVDSHDEDIEEEFDIQDAYKTDIQDTDIEEEYIEPIHHQQPVQTAQPTQPTQSAPVVSAPTFAPIPPTSSGAPSMPPGLTIGSDESEEEEEKPKKPAAFMKAFGSLKK